MFGRYGRRDLNTEDQPPIPLPSGGGGNGTIYARNKQLALGATYTGSARSLLEVRFGWSSTEGGKNPPALGSTSALEAFGISGLPTDPRISGGLPTQQINGYFEAGAAGHQSAVAVPDGVESEDQRDMAVRPPFGEDRLRVPAHRRRGAWT